MIYAGILAGGVGRRMGAEMPKQFLEIAGRPIIIHTLERFMANPRFEKIFVATVVDYMDYLRELMAKFLPADPRVTIIEGGADRNGSIEAITLAARADDPEEKCAVLVHDAARPFVSDQTIEDSIDAVLEYGAMSAAIPAQDTIMRSEEEGRITSVPIRSQMFLEHSPQGFFADYFIEDYGKTTPEQRKTMTDSTALMAAAGRYVRIVASDPFNIKITTPFDLVMGEAIAMERARERAQENRE